MEADNGDEMRTQALEHAWFTLTRFTFRRDLPPGRVAIVTFEHGDGWEVVTTDKSVYRLTGHVIPHTLVHRHHSETLPPSSSAFRVYKGDAVAVLRSLDADICFDVCICSPPYNQKSLTSDGKSAFYGTGYHDDMEDAEYIRMMTDMMTELDKRGVRVVVLILNWFKRNPFLPTQLVGAIGRSTRYQGMPLIWLKQRAMPGGGLRRIGEHVWVFGTSPASVFPVNQPYPWHVQHGWWPIRDVVFTVEPDTDTEKRRHMDEAAYVNAAKAPLNLMGRLVATYCKPGDRIIDPFMGSGTTLEACLMGPQLHATGIDLNPAACSFVEKWLCTKKPTADHPYARLGHALTKSLW